MPSKGLNPPYEPLLPLLNKTAHQIVDAAYKVHSNLGPGLLESVYEICLEHELRKKGLSVKRQMGLPIIYENLYLDGGLRLDMLVESCVVVEIKAVEVLLPVHFAQVLTYLKLSGHRLGLLVNFNVAMIKEGLKRIIL
ncbi:MAG: GxxExxY protein [Deltaproteobacteria bacterium]|nr:GxxExxY protein [Deltaproteobacteria bacterium]